MDLKNESNPSFTAPRDDYRQKCERYRQRISQFEQRNGRMALSRGLTFFLAVGLAIAGWLSNDLQWLLFTGAGAAFAGFVAIAFVHEQLLDEVAMIREKKALMELQLARLDRRWENIPVPKVEVPEGHQAVSADLDLFGPASLFQLISAAHTPLGDRRLRDWLLEPACPSEIKLRQQAVSRLAPEADLREELDLRGRLLRASQTGPAAFVQWAESPSWLSQRGCLKWLARGLTVAICFTLLAGFIGLTEPLVMLVGVLGLLAVNTCICAFCAGTIHGIFDSVSSRHNEAQSYWRLFEMIAELPDDCEFFRRLQASVGDTPREPLVRLSTLMRIMAVANLRRAGLLGIPYIASQLTLLADFHLLGLLESWQARHGRFVRCWFEAVAQLEALSSLATLAHDHPNWILPSVDGAETRFRARSLGHPLLADEDCVRNDVEVGPTDTFLLVTGSNMSGKSTLLRAIGINATLAQAGGPVCAAEFQMPPLEIATSMRVHDSLADGVSFFMAELKRMKQIVDQARDLQQSGERLLLYLLDEILQGTNSAERQIAVSRIIRYLISHGAIGAVSTHDLELGSLPELADPCHLVHFRENIVKHDGRQQMTFDYVLREGLAPTTNALKLLELVGLRE